jgi:hypothetical protein
VIDERDPWLGADWSNRDMPLAVFMLLSAERTNSPAGLNVLTAILRASSLLNNLAADRRPGGTKRI